METDKPVIVFYHADCKDGFGGAWAAWKKFGDTAEYLPYFHNEEPPAFTGKEIYMIDMVFEKKEILDQMLRDNKRVTAIDHHVSTKDAVLRTQDPLFDNDHSGSVLAWKYFFSNEPTPELLLVIEDGDIWKFEIPDSRALYRYLDMQTFDFETWSKLALDFENKAKRKEMAEKGQLIVDFEKLVIERNITDNARLVTFEGYTVYAINAANFVSDMGNKLATSKPPFSIMWREKKDGSIAVSLRGVGDVDCSKIAVKYGGGGHRYSSAFILKSIADIPWKPVEVM